MKTLREWLKEFLSEDFRIKIATKNRILIDNNFGEQDLAIFSYPLNNYLIRISSYNEDYPAIIAKMVYAGSIDELISYLENNLQKLFNELEVA